MVSCYNHPSVAMFSRQPNGHHHLHHHHPSPTQNHYFAPAYGTGYYPHHPHQSVASATTPTVPTVGVGVSGTQFSPSMTPDFNQQPYHHQFSNMHMTSADTMAAAAAASWPQSMYSACAARAMSNGYDDWATGHAHAPATATGHPPPPTPFYHHQHQQSTLTPRSTPSPNSTHNGGQHSPSIYTSNSSLSFKTEFGPCSGGNPQESSQEMPSQGSGPMVRSAGCTPHSPDSGMAVSDGVSSSGSPANGGGGQHCLGGGTHHLSSSATMSSLNPSMLGSQPSNLNQQSIHARPTQARSPYEWMRKATYSTISVNAGGKTRTKDKYRVVYSDNQRLELEKEFHFSRYITIRRKQELAAGLGLSERQIKIWFQNRRAKERKVNRKREEQIDQHKVAMVHMHNAVGTLQLTSGPVMCNGGPNGNTGPLHSNLM